MEEINKINLDVLYNFAPYTMNDDLSLEEIFAKQNKQSELYKQLAVIQKFIKECRIEEFFSLIIKIFKDKAPSIRYFTELLFVEFYRGKDYAPIIRTSDINGTLLKSIFKDGALTYQELNFNFSVDQNVNVIIDNIKKNIADMKFKVSENFIIIENSPIKTLEINKDSLKIKFNPELAIIK